jgi:uncharacterized protein
MSPLIILAVMAAGSVAGALGALLGIGGGVFLVPFLVLGLGLPIKMAAGISLVTVIATSSAVSAASTGRQLINLRMGLVLELATAAGGLLGGVTAQVLSERALNGSFGIVTGVIAVVMLRGAGRADVSERADADPGRLGGRYFDPEAGRVVTYRLRRTPLALAISFFAGNVANLLGIGGGILKVPALNAWCGIPFRVAAATSAFMIGVTAAAGVPLYYAEGHVIPELAAAAVLGVLAGSRGGLRFGAVARSRWLKLLMTGVLAAVSVLMCWRAL